MHQNEEQKQEQEQKDDKPILKLKMQLESVSTDIDTWSIIDILDGCISWGGSDNDNNNNNEDRQMLSREQLLGMLLNHGIHKYLELNQEIAIHIFGDGYNMDSEPNINPTNCNIIEGI